MGGRWALLQTCRKAYCGGAKDCCTHSKAGAGLPPPDKCLHLLEQGASLLASRERAELDWGGGSDPGEGQEQQPWLPPYPVPLLRLGSLPWASNISGAQASSPTVAAGTLRGKGTKCPLPRGDL